MQVLVLAILLSFGALASPKPANFAAHLVAGGLQGGYQVLAADLNQDGRPDLIALASGMKDLVWYENPGWQRHVIVSDMNRMINLAAWDTNGDGIPEILLASDFANEARNSIGIVSLLEHDGDVRKPWKLTEIDRIPTTHRIRAADLFGNGKKVAVSAPLAGPRAVKPDYRDKTPLVYYTPDQWIRRHIPFENEGVVHGIYICDWDGDGREDILTASFQGIHLFRLGKNGEWSKTEIAKGDPSPWPQSGSSDVAAGKTGMRKFVAAIEPWHGNQVAVYLEEKGKWIRQVIDTDVLAGHTILTADLNGDGMDEIVAGFRGPSQTVWVYSSAKPDGRQWSRRAVDSTGMPASSCVAADLNGDGRPDLACISATALKWYENKGAAE